MPNSLRTINKPLKTCRSLSQGFTLVEIAIALFVILVAVGISFTVTGTYLNSRRSNLQMIAAKIATRQVENLRNTAFASLPSCPTPNDCLLTDPDLSKLPGSNTSFMTIANYQSDTKIKLVTVQVNWTETSAQKNIKVETLIYENGL